MKLISLAVAAAAFVVLPAMAADSSGSSAQGKAPAKVAQVCAACHGLHGKAKAPIYPDLGGQYKDYIEQALREYRNGERVNPIMTPMAKSLTPQQIPKIAEWYSHQKPVIYTPDADVPFVPKAKSK